MAGDKSLERDRILRNARSGGLPHGNPDSDLFVLRFSHVTISDYAGAAALLRNQVGRTSQQLQLLPSRMLCCNEYKNGNLRNAPDPGGRNEFTRPGMPTILHNRAFGRVFLLGPF